MIIYLRSNLHCIGFLDDIAIAVAMLGCHYADLQYNVQPRLYIQSPYTSEIHDVVSDLSCTGFLWVFATMTVAIAKQYHVFITPYRKLPFGHSSNVLHIRERQWASIDDRFRHVERPSCPLLYQLFIVASASRSDMNNIYYYVRYPCMLGFSGVDEHSCSAKSIYKVSVLDQGQSTTESELKQGYVTSTPRSTPKETKLPAEISMVEGESSLRRCYGPIDNFECKHRCGLKACWIEKEGEISRKKGKSNLSMMSNQGTEAARLTYAHRCVTKVYLKFQSKFIERA